MKLLKGISSYRLRDSLIYLRENRSYTVLDYNRNEIKKQRNFEEFFHFTDNDNYLLFGVHSYVYKVDEDKFCDFIAYRIRDRYGVIPDEEDYKKSKLYSFDKSKAILKNSLPLVTYPIDSQYWCNDTEKDFKLIDAEKGEILWTIPQPKVEKPYGYNGSTNIKKVLGIYKDYLWLQLPDSRIWALDIHSGELKEEIKHFYFSSIPEGIFLSQKGTILIFHYNIYAVYDIEAKSFLVDKIISDENELIIRNVSYREDDVNLYFTGNKDKSFYPNIYGIFDTEKKEVIFQREEIEEGGHFYQEPQVNNELFTILDNKGNLIIHKIDEIL